MKLSQRQTWGGVSNLTWQSRLCQYHFKNIYLHINCCVVSFSVHIHISFLLSYIVIMDFLLQHFFKNSTSKFNSNLNNNFDIDCLKVTLRCILVFWASDLPKVSSNFIGTFNLSTKNGILGLILGTHQNIIITEQRLILLKLERMNLRILMSSQQTKSMKLWKSGLTSAVRGDFLWTLLWYY